jgi:hypothetical protein
VWTKKFYHECNYLQGNEGNIDPQHLSFLHQVGMDPDFYDHDHWVVESQGEIVDRTTENLGTTDRAIVLMRRQLLRAIEDVRAGRDPLLVRRRPGDYALDDFFTGSKVERVAPVGREPAEAVK